MEPTKRDDINKTFDKLHRLMDTLSTFIEKDATKMCRAVTKCAETYVKINTEDTVKPRQFLVISFSKYLTNNEGVQSVSIPIEDIRRYWVNKDTLYFALNESKGVIGEFAIKINPDIIDSYLVKNNMRIKDKKCKLSSKEIMYSLYIMLEKYIERCINYGTKNRMDIDENLIAIFICQLIDNQDEDCSLDIVLNRSEYTHRY
jgi:hypothetical protein